MKKLILIAVFCLAVITLSGCLPMPPLPGPPPGLPGPPRL
jgi:hypothetical protein